MSNHNVPTCEFARKWLNWVQNSDFEGEATPATLRAINLAASTIIREEQDSVLFYEIPAGTKWQREVLRIEKLTTSNIL